MHFFCYYVGKYLDDLMLNIKNVHTPIFQKLIILYFKGQIFFLNGDDVGRDAIFSTILSTMLNIDKSRLWSYRPISFFSVLTKSCFTLPLPPHFKPAGSGFQAQQTNALGAEEGIHIGDQRGTSCWLQYCVYTIIQVLCALSTQSTSKATRQDVVK